LFATLEDRMVDMVDASREAWPSLPPETWPDTRASLHLWTQMVGKLRLALSPPQNHFWHSSLYVTARGLTMSPMPYGPGLVQVDFDFLDHRLGIESSWGGRQAVPLAPKSVADFYAEVMAALGALGVDVRIRTRPVEIPDLIPFERDRVHAAYDPAAAHAFWRALIQVDRVFREFRGRFLGKSSPVHFLTCGCTFMAERDHARVLLARTQQRGLLAGRRRRAVHFLELRRPRAGGLRRGGDPPEQCSVQRPDGRVRPALRERAHGGTARPGPARVPGDHLRRCELVAAGLGAGSRSASTLYANRHHRALHE
jgi:hypothetical protein